MKRNLMVILNENNEEVKLMELDLKEIGRKLFNARKNKDLSRKALGKIVKLHESTIKRYEDGEIGSVSVQHMINFAQALDVDAAWIMGLQNEMRKSKEICGQLDETRFSDDDIKDIKTYIEFVKARKK